MILDSARENLEKLGLPAASGTLTSCTEEAAKENLSHLDFLNLLLEEELRVRKERCVKTRLKMSRLPYQKTIEGFDFSFQPSIDKKRVKTLFSLSFIAEKENIVFLGPPGVGKTHLAVALGFEAIRGGMSCYFTSAYDLFFSLLKAHASGTLERKLSVYTSPKLLIIDEMGYLPLDTLEANLFFLLVSRRYEKGSVILTSNKGYAEWGSLLGDKVMATAILDRLLHHSITVNIKGESYRLKEKHRAGILKNLEERGDEEP